MSEEEIVELRLSKVFSGARYEIPIYQRAYAWGKDEIETLIDDIRDYHSQRKGSYYYIGTLVVHKKKGIESGETVYEVIDGQQRLTTLFLLLCWFNHKKENSGIVRPSLDFECRARSTEALRTIWDSSEDPSKVETDAGADEIHGGYKIVSSKLSSQEYDECFVKYLLEDVIIIRAELPEETDLNHYFEVMNSRGEQLEKHEVVKASLMSKLDDDKNKQSAFAKIWDACSDMTRYVQAGFSSGERDALFGQEWDRLKVGSFAEAIKVLDGTEDISPGTEGRSIHAILDTRKSDSSATSALGASAIDDDDSGRYGTIIGFPNFLLHALKVDSGDSFGWDEDGPGERVPLDDKKLIEAFEKKLESSDDVERFIFRLLQLRVCFDSFVIKVDSYKDNTEDDSNWSLRTVRKEQYNLQAVNTFNDSRHKTILNLQAMFQVTDSRQIYKTFLFGILDYFHRKNYDFKVIKEGFEDFLIELADTRARHFINAGASGSSPAAVGTTIADQGVRTPHYLFNYLDFILWYSNPEQLSGKSISDFRFSYRNSIEHFSPQRPDKSAQLKDLDEATLNSFGNLCLMTKRENSRRSNLLPEAKIKEYDSSKQSLKFQVMATIAKDKGWERAEITEHGRAMRHLLSQGIRDSGDGRQNQ
ncbi:MAG: DUF262 domain-containing HNH endonuclease family protein [Coriobacteriales bacterium]|jgi:hypothetical protein|nr:DUF262 domain-containing HNH endonuclease family protein [Coriobacteriales bacterium]